MIAGKAHQGGKWHCRTRELRLDADQLNARYTHKRLVVAAAGQCPQVGVAGVWRADLAATAANRLFVPIQAPKDSTTRAPGCRAARTTFRREHSNRGRPAPIWCAGDRSVHPA